MQIASVRGRRQGAAISRRFVWLPIGDRGGELARCHGSWEPLGPSRSL